MNKVIRMGLRVIALEALLERKGILAQGEVLEELSRLEAIVKVAEEEDLNPGDERLRQLGRELWQG